MRPVDLARRHGLSTQAVRNYEQDGCLPAADRTPAGYRSYTELHDTALGTYLALIRGHGHANAGTIMRAANAGDPDGALRGVDDSHVRLQRDRATLDAVRDAIDLLAGDRPEVGSGTGTYSIGAVAHRLGVTAATLRAWEGAGIVDPRRNPATGHREFGPEDLRDAELARLLRRGGERLEPDRDRDRPGPRRRQHRRAGRVAGRLAGPAGRARAGDDRRRRAARKLPGPAPPRR
ncbi:MerR family DNA-binding transcriptional regulator [Microlunatus sp. GCM10028923]|uniref:MerR family DNA-binding transcriptional regulator n=1 Tax=Microlunatus sp. GCM10028923 TaxID=3273400 RepID=UPI003612ABA4